MRRRQMESNFKTTKDYWNMLGQCARYICALVMMIAIGMYSYEYGFHKGVESVPRTYLTPSIQDVDTQCTAWLFDIGGSQAKARICKK